MASHGTRSRYNAGCRCDPCRMANREYERSRCMRRVAEECGAPARMVDAGPVRERLQELQSRGYSEKEICRLSGISRSCIRGISRKHHRSGKPVSRVRRETKDAIFSIKGRRMPSAGQIVDATWMAGWIHEYKSRGMSIATMQRITHIDRQTLDALLHGKRSTVVGRTLHRFLMCKPALDKAIGKGRA